MDDENTKVQVRIARSSFWACALCKDCICTFGTTRKKGVKKWDVCSGHILGSLNKNFQYWKICPEFT